jgi:hypothetical protein
MSRLLFVAECLAASAVTLTTAGCGDSSSPTRGLGARYELTSYDDQPLPYTWRRIVAVSGPYACDDQITGGRLLFGTSHSVTEVFDRTLVCNDGSAPVISGDTAAGQYTEAGDQLDLVLQGALTAQARSTYEVSAMLDGDVIRVQKTVSNTQLDGVTDVGVKVFTLRP